MEADAFQPVHQFHCSKVNSQLASLRRQEEEVRDRNPEAYIAERSRCFLAPQLVLSVHVSDGQNCCGVVSVLSFFTTRYRFW